MKSNILIIMTFSFLFLFSCKKEIEESTIIYESGDQEFGWAIGTKEGKDWEASGYWRYHENDSTYLGVTFNTYSIYAAQREHFALNEIPISLGTFQIKDGFHNLGDGYVGGIFGLFADDGDAIIGALEVNNDEDGYITISEIDTITHTIKGSFEIYFASENKNLKVEIKNGEFEVRLYEE